MLPWWGGFGWDGRQGLLLFQTAKFAAVGIPRLDARTFYDLHVLGRPKLGRVCSDSCKAAFIVKPDTS